MKKAEKIGFIGILALSWAYCNFFTQGLPLWDDDYYSIFYRFDGKSFWQCVWQWLWPISTQPQFWGFNERPFQAVIYKLCYAFVGYEGWLYFLLKNLALTACVGMIYLWSLRVLNATERGSARFRSILAAAIALFFLTTPAVLGAQLWHADFAAYAEAAFLGLTYWMWNEIEERKDLRWLLRWTVFSIAVYLSYKIKADLKVLPLILAVYVGIFHRSDWKWFAWPLAWMLLLAVPWGPGIFSHLPPFIPGSALRVESYMWRPASMGGVLEYLGIQRNIWDILFSLQPQAEVLSSLGPLFLLLIAAPFLGRKSLQEKRVLSLGWIWSITILAAASSLPSINPFFRIRYGILFFTPFSLVLAWGLGRLSTQKDGRIYAPGLAISVISLLFYIGLNFERSIEMRNQQGHVAIEVEQAYSYVNSRLPNVNLFYGPTFNRYTYFKEANRSIRELHPMSSWDILDRVAAQDPRPIYVLDWKDSLAWNVERAEWFSGCGSDLFDRIFEKRFCGRNDGIVLLRYIGRQPALEAANDAFTRGDLAAARQSIDTFLLEHPQSSAGHFLSGIIADHEKDPTRFKSEFAAIAPYLSSNFQVTYNLGIASRQTHDYESAITLLRSLLPSQDLAPQEIAKNGSNYGVFWNLYVAYRGLNRKTDADALYRWMLKIWPNDPTVQGLPGEIR